MDQKNEVTVDFLADEINRREGELVVLRQAFELLGGTYDEDEAEEKPKRKQIRKKNKAAQEKEQSRAAEPDEFGVTINGTFIELRERQAAVVELMLAAENKLLSKDAITECWGSPMNYAATFKSINGKLAAVGMSIVLVKGKGFQLQKIA